jgi:hypothetical protein
MWNWALLERPLDARPLDSFPAFHGIRRFNTKFTRALHLFLSLAKPNQSTSPHPTSPRSILILSTHLRLGLPSGLFPSGFSSSPPHSCYMAHPSHTPRIITAYHLIKFHLQWLISFPSLSNIKYKLKGRISTHIHNKLCIRFRIIYHVTLQYPPLSYRNVTSTSWFTRPPWL